MWFSGGRMPFMDALTRKSLDHLMALASDSHQGMAIISPDDRREIIQAASRISNLFVADCSHKLRPLKPDELADDWMSISAICTICREDFGWRCKLSPDGICHTFAEPVKGGFIVELMDGTQYKLPPKIAKKLKECGNSGDYGSDCVFCNLPDERK
jgi:hypothetical protein